MSADDDPRYERDSDKRILNLLNHRLDFRDVDEFDWDAAKHWRSDRRGEIRYSATSTFRGKMHTVIYTERQDVTRVISFRRANKQEERRYAAA